MVEVDVLREIGDRVNEFEILPQNILKIVGFVVDTTKSPHNVILEHEEVIRSLLTKLLCKESLAAYWKASINSKNASILTIINEIHNIYRLLTNALRSNFDWLLSKQEFDDVFIGAMDDNCFTLLLEEYTSLPVDIKPAVCRNLANRRVEKLTIKDGNYIDICCDMLRVLSAINIDNPFNAIEGSKDLIQYLLSKIAAEEDNITIMTEKLILNKSYNKEMAIVIVNSVGKSQLKLLANCVASCWASKHFVVKGDKRRQEYWTTILLQAMKKLDKSDIIESENNDVPLLSMLSHGVANYLNTSDRQSRIFGMQIASCMAKITGHNLHFDELDEYEKRELETTAPLTDIPIEPNTQSEHNVRQSRLNELTSDSDNDSDEIEAYDMFDPSIAKQTTNYLKHCLDLLRTSDSKPEASDAHLKALNSIPSIVASEPWDFRDVTPLLTRELIRLANAFNIEKFDDLRDASLEALLCTYPKFSFPTAVEMMVSTELLTVGTKLSTLAIMIKSATIVSGIDSKATVTKDSTMLLQTSATLTTPSTDIGTSVTSSSSSTIIKRPRKLALSKVKQSFHRNKFADIAKICYFPMLRALGNTMEKLLHGNSSTSISLVEDVMFNANIPQLTQTIVNTDPMDFLLPAQFVNALAAFTRCAIHTIYQRGFTESTLKVALAFKDIPNQGFHRAVLYAIICSLESWKDMVESDKINGTSQHRGNSGMPRTVLQSLLDVTGQLSLQDRASSHPASSAGSVIVETVTALVDWAVKSATNEADELCRSMLLQIGKMSIEIFNNFK